MRSFFELPALLALALLIQHHPAASGKEPPQEPLVRDDDGAIIFQVAGGFRSTQAAAKESALLEAQLQMALVATPAGASDSPCAEHRDDSSQADRAGRYAGH